MDKVYVYPTQVLSSVVNLEDDLTVLIEGCKWLIDSI